MLVSGSDLDGTVRLGDVESDKNNAKFKIGESLRYVVFRPDGKRSAARGNNNSVRLWDVEKTEKVGQVKWFPLSRDGLPVSPNGKTLAQPYSKEGRSLIQLRSLLSAKTGL